MQANFPIGQLNGQETRGVKRIKAYMEVIKEGDSSGPPIRIFNGITRNDYDTLETLFDDAKIWCAFYLDAEVLVMRSRSVVHDQSAELFSRDAFRGKRFDRLYPRRGKTFFFPEDGPPNGDFAVPDYTIEAGFSSFLVLEVSCSQTLAEVTAKADQYLTTSSVEGVIIINVEESPQFRAPILDPSEGTFDPHLFLEEARRSAAANPWGPIEVAGHVWQGRITFEFLLFVRDKPVATMLVPNVSVADMAAFNNNLRLLWNTIVEKAADPKIQPAEVGIDWEDYYAEIERSVIYSAHLRYRQWHGRAQTGRRKKRKRTHDEFMEDDE